MESKDCEKKCVTIEQWSSLLLHIILYDNDEWGKNERRRRRIESENVSISSSNWRKNFPICKTGYRKWRIENEEDSSLNPCSKWNVTFRSLLSLPSIFSVQKKKYRMKPFLIPSLPEISVEMREGKKEFSTLLVDHNINWHVEDGKREKRWERECLLGN